ncbi:GMC oxidoreductase [Gilvimarinus sp. DA14]|uniref:GMC oxidoreductase n=1 Tax=Gilvimarinus sp. DA14 TaxID=2956798 RepID=UPI0020B81747|nr:GMC oxidoreductase [Gilvimarinus sp. DA14]UTF59706.1 GMC oxidoreductase [Gilvimarinus sp. DA14]
MIKDLETESPAHNTLSADICIAGAGPAGIVLALELARARPDWHIVLCEAGGPDNATEAERDIYNVSLGEKSYPVLDFSRRRRLGGTSIHWGGWSKPLDTTDYEDNPKWDVPAWPITPSEIEQHLDRALYWTEIDNGEFNLASIRQAHTGHLLPLRKDSAIGEQLFRFSPPTRFGTRYTDELRSQENLTCLLHANLHELEKSGDRIVSASVKPLNGDSTSINADQFVLAMGGMESTRHLLNLRDKDSDDGIGIYSKHLGRYFSDHYGARPGMILAPEGLKYHRFTQNNETLMPVLTFSEQQIRQNREHNSCMILTAESADDSVLNQYGGQPALGFHSGNYWHYRVQMIVEPRPNPSSRLILTNERCALGMRRMHLDWKPHRDDFNSAYRLYRSLGEELNLTGLGRSQITRQNTEANQAAASGACHHLGTTRMAANEHDGVVDTNLKVFGSDNLFVASSSVFPRYGYSNPTLTIAALSVRLAKHLSQAEGAGQ